MIKFANSRSVDIRTFLASQLKMTQNDAQKHAVCLLADVLLKLREHDARYDLTSASIWSDLEDQVDIHDRCVSLSLIGVNVY